MLAAGIDCSVRNQLNAGPISELHPVWDSRHPFAVDPNTALIALNMVDHVGPVRLRQLTDHLGDPVAVLSASRTQLLKVPGIGDETAEAIASWKNSVDLDAELKRIEAHGCQVVTQLDAHYPERLREIYDPPMVLYVKGSLSSQDKNSVAVVGSRQTTNYGIETARRLSYQLAYTGVTVVSGGARGIDTAAHQGAMTAKGRTIAVLGTGINRVFPPENRDLFERIASQGAVMTQFPFDRPADKQTFPIRNRIVAGMTLGTVVVEANLASGALITANFANEYGRQVFAVPGRIDSPRSKGCHDLIKKGAKLCEGIEDVLSEFEYLFPPSNRSATPTETGVLPGLELPENEQCVLSVLTRESQTVDELIRASGLPASAVNVVLFSLEMKRLIRQLPGKLYVRASV